MSHFSVLVIGSDVKEQLAPFQENNNGDCPRQYMTFHDEEDEFLSEYESDSTEMVKMEDGSYAYTWDERFRVSGTYGVGSNSHKVPDHLQTEEVRHRDRFPTFDDFCKDWHNAHRDPETGRYGYWENPNKKWDWYVVGGRYSGKLKLKAGALGGVGTRSWTNEHEDIAVDFVDSARVSDIDWDGMHAARIDQYAKYWEEGQTCTEQERNWRFGIEPGMTQEQYLLQAEEFSVFAVVKDGKWYERGEMGWWGFVSNEKDKEEWKSQLRTILESLPGDTLLTVVDCHI